MKIVNRSQKAINHFISLVCPFFFVHLYILLLLFLLCVYQKKMDRLCRVNKEHWKRNKFFFQKWMMHVMMMMRDEKCKHVYRLYNFLSAQLLASSYIYNICNILNGDQKSTFFSTSSSQICHRATDDDYERFQLCV